MLERILSLPLVVLVMGIGAISMMLPAVHASIISDDEVARSFFYNGLLFMALFALIAVATSATRIRRQGRSHLISLLATFTVLPVMLAVPFQDALRTTSFFNAWFEMVSSLTTTGATLFSPERVPPSAHLWRAQVGWMGGFFVWVTAVAVLAPMNLGGFEVRGTGGQIGQGAVGATPITRVADPSERLAKFAFRFLPVYAGLTTILWAVLFVLGDPPLVALCHAMSTLATSAISPVGGLNGAQSGVFGEVIIFLFLIFALSRLTFAAEERPEGWTSLRRDPELRLGLMIVVAVPLILVLRHWIGAYEVRADENLGAILKTFWGSAFTVMSFLTTTGFESSLWGAARQWSGLQTPGLILMGLAVFGGGVATTAGGVKLLRVYALYQHGTRELEKLLHPNSIGGSGGMARAIRRQGAYLAWVFFMLFAISIAAAMLAFAFLGLDFEDSLVLTIASLTTTGPLTAVVTTNPIDLAQIGDAAKAIFAVAMVVGRLETLAIIALLNPDFWRS